MANVGQTYSVEPMGDQRALDALLAIANDLGRGKYNLLVHRFGADQPFDLTKQSDDDVRQALAEVLKADLDVLERLSLRPLQGLQGLATLEFHRSKQVVQLSGNPVSDPLRVLQSVRAHLVPAKAVALRERFTAEQRQYLEQSELVVGQLRDTAHRVLVESIESRATLDREFAEKRKSLEEEHDSRRRELEAEVARLKAELDSQRAALDARIQAVADREALHERRAKGQQLHQDLRARRAQTSLSKETNQTRIWVHMLCVVTLLVLSLAFFGVIPVPLDGDTDVGVWAQQIRRVLIGAGLGGVLWFYIRFTADWFKKHSETEFRLRQFELDVDRANWLVEVTREWADAKVEPTPGLIDAISRGMFTSVEARTEPPVSALTELARHMDRGERVRVKIGENEVELGRGGVKAAGGG